MESMRPRLSSTGALGQGDAAIGWCPPTSPLPADARGLQEAGRCTAAHARRCSSRAGVSQRWLAAALQPAASGAAAVPRHLLSRRAPTPPACLAAGHAHPSPFVCLHLYLACLQAACSNFRGRLADAVAASRARRSGPRRATASGCRRRHVSRWRRAHVSRRGRWHGRGRGRGLRPAGPAC